ncbi:MAG: transglycosylase domain-containing protein [Magnetovibrionaceae bacterium]
MSTLKWSATAAIWGLIAVIGLVAWYAYDLPDVDEALAATRKPSMTLIAADGSVLNRRGEVFGGPAQLADLPPALPQAVLATEDRRFYDHFGLDVIGLGRAVISNAMAGRIRQGGSTITQQLAKNLFLSPERTIKRKIQEVLLALWLEARFSKDQILTVYLNRVYLGAGAYGVNAAALRYFDREARELSVYQSALIAGLLKAPSRYNPIASPERARNRTEVVLANMVAAGYLSEADRAASLTGARVATTAKPRFARHVSDWIAERVRGHVGHPDRDLVVYTSLDARLQRRAEGILRENLDFAGAPQGAVIVMAPDGAVLAMTGARDGSAFNRAVQARRQAGSAFKPFVYLAALEAGWQETSLISDAPIRIGNWQPRNFTRRSVGELSLGDALASSSNTAAVRLTEQIGRQKVARIATRFGLRNDGPVPASLALGTWETSLIDLTRAYAVLANGGQGVLAHAIIRIEDGEGRVLFDRQASGLGQLARPDHLVDLTRMMTLAVDGGTARQAAIDRPIAAKTGTTQGYRDAWLLGFSADRIGGVWLGHDNARGMALPDGKGITGGGLPALIWRDVMMAAHEGLPVRPLVEPRPVDAPIPIARADERDEGGSSFWDRLQDLLSGT